MCGLLIKRSVRPCPNCGAGFYVEAGIFADDQIYRCDNCGTRIYIEMRFGKITSASAMPTISDDCKGYGGINNRAQSHRVNEISGRVGNVGYWKKNHGENWLRAHDEWERKDDEWWDKHK